METKRGLLVGVHFSKFFGKPGRAWFDEGKLHVRPRGGAIHAYGGPLKIVRKLTEPPFANHWIEVNSLEGTPVWLTCSKSRALELARQAEASGLEVVWPKRR